MIINRFFVGLILVLFSFSAHSLAQSENHNTRATQWESYTLPSGEFTRFVTKGYSLWHPVQWKETVNSETTVSFGSAEKEKHVLVITEALAEGYGVANYTTALLQQLRKQPITLETVAVRRVLIGGVEGREISLEIEAEPGKPVFQTYWVTQVGPTGYAFIFTSIPDNKEKLEPNFKRLMMSVRFNTAGHWDEEFETLRAKFATGKNSEHDGEAAKISEALRAARENTGAAIQKIAELATQAPEIALEMLTDYDPNVRGAAITALGKSADGRNNEALVWALADKDIFCSNSAAKALAERGAPAFLALKNNLPKLVEANGALLRVAALMSDEAARELADELLKSKEAKFQINGLQMALILPLKGLQLPYAKLFTTDDVSVTSFTMEAIRRRHPVEDVPELTKMIGTDAELWAVHALGELAPPALAMQLEERRKLLGSRYDKLLVSKGVMTIRAGSSTKYPLPPPMPTPTPKIKSRKNPPNGIIRGVPGGVVGVPPAIRTFDNYSSPASTPPELFKTESEMVKLWSLTSELEDAVSKIKFRADWASAKDEAARQTILDETKKNERLNQWDRVALKRPVENSSTLKLDLAKLKNSPTTGETIFPANATLYLQAPNFEQTINKLDAALAGIQMGTVRDQMTLALMLNSLKAQLANKMNLEATGSATSTLGLDLQAPISMAAWPSATDKGNLSTIANSAVMVRVTDRVRFERTLMMYQTDFGSFDTFVPVVSAGARFASITPALIPLIFYVSASVGDFVGPRSGKSPTAPYNLASSSYIRQEKIDAVPVTVFEKLRYVGIDLTSQETIYVAYLGDNAVVAPSREALIEALNTDKPTIASNKSYERIKAETGDLIYFSQLDKLAGSFFAEIGKVTKNTMEKDPVESFIMDGFVRALGAETGAMRLSQSSWESVFHLPSGEADLIKTLRPFKATDLAAPRDLLPKNTLFYAATIIDPAKFVEYEKKWDAELAQAKKASGKEEKKKDTKAGDKIADLEKLLVPHLQGEISFALLNISKIFKGEARLPSMVVAFKLKDDALAKTARSGLASLVLKRVPNVTMMTAPVFKLGDDADDFYALATDQYFIVADSLETFKLLEAKEKFALARDFIRPASIAPERLAFFSTYNLDAAFDEARIMMNKGADKGAKDNTENYFMDAMSAWSHAFHSQRMLLAFADEKMMEGQLGVSFDREGRYNVGAMNRKEFDLENALLEPTGLDISRPTRIAALKIKVSAKQPGVLARVREDVSKFAGQKIEPDGNENNLVFTSTQRRIPDNLTIKLPVSGAEFEPYLKATSRINANSPEIINLAKEIAGKEKDGRKVARKIGNWTFENLKWKKVQSTTVETLATREADCLEHAELYVALSRALGLPARVVVGAAYGGGSFGSHAWVEIYLGKWVEVDPTWGLTEYVDATHLRFDGNGFISYAQLNQASFEILAAHPVVADFQRDPIQLVNEFSAQGSEELRSFVFDLDLSAEQILGAGALAKLDKKQRTLVQRAFNKIVSDVTNEWVESWDSKPSIIAKEIKNDQATVLAVFASGLIRLSLTARNNVWYVTEIENVDESEKFFSESLHSALNTGTSLTKIRQLQNSNPSEALKQVEKLIAAQGESAPLLFLKARIIEAKQTNEALEEANKEAKATNGKPAQDEKKSVGRPNAALPIWQEITRRWTDYAPAYYALGLTSESQPDAGEKAIAAFKRYAQLMPLDPRPWREMSNIFETAKRMSEAENAFREALNRDRENIDPHVNLVAFYLRQTQPEKARESLTAALKQLPDANAVFRTVDWQIMHQDEDTTPEMAQLFEALLMSFPKELFGSWDGLRGLSEAQRTQKKYDVAIKTLQKVVALQPDGGDQTTIASIYRETRRFPPALLAATQAIKQDPESAEGYFERACALTQLGRKREAIAALTKAIEFNKFIVHRLESEADLKPLAALPAFKALLPKEEESENEAASPPQSKAANQ